MTKEDGEGSMEAALSTDNISTLAAKNDAAHKKLVLKN